MGCLAVTLSAGTDAANAVKRLQALYEAEVQVEHKQTDANLPVAVRVEHADFTWDAPPPDTSNAKPGKPGKSKDGKKAKDKKGPGSAGAAKDTPTSGSQTPAEERIFKLNDINLDIPRGQLVAVVGAVGSGKSSLLQGLIGGEFTLSSRFARWLMG